MGKENFRLLSLMELEKPDGKAKILTGNNGNKAGKVFKFKLSEETNFLAG